MLRDNATAAVEMRPPGEIPWEYCRESKAVEFLKSRPTQYIYIIYIPTISVPKNVEFKLMDDRLFIFFLKLGLHFCLLCDIYKAWIEYLDVHFEFHLDILYLYSSTMQ